MLKALALAAALLVAAPAYAQTAEDVNVQIESLLGSHEVFETAIQTIQKAVAERDLVSLGGYIAFGEPIMVNGAEIIIDDEAQFEATYDDLFNQKVVDAVTGQDYGQLFVNADGIMFGTGELWITGICIDDACDDFFVNIIAINNQ
jgi:hypothetical protein